MRLSMDCLRSLAIFLSVVAAFQSPANERIRSPEQLRNQGYRHWQPIALKNWYGFPVAEHSLDWPVRFQDSAHSLGNAMAQFQPFSDPPYFHGGCDLRGQARSEIYAPVEGRIEAGHYSYSTNADGALETMAAG